MTPPQVVASDVRQRIRELLSALDFSGHSVARQLRWMGARTTGPLISQWLSGKRNISIQSVALLALLHPMPYRCFEWLLRGGVMPRIPDYTRDAKALGLTEPAAPSAPLTGEGAEILDAVHRAIEFTLREDRLEYANSRQFVRSLIAMADTVEEQGGEAVHLWQAISYIKAKAAATRHLELANPAPDVPKGKRHEIPPDP